MENLEEMKGVVWGIVFLRSRETTFMQAQERCVQVLD